MKEQHNIPTDNIKESQGGSATIQVLVTVFILGMVGIVIIGLVGQQATTLVRISQTMEIQSDGFSVVNAFIQALEADKTPEVHSKDDAWYLDFGGERWMDYTTEKGDISETITRTTTDRTLKVRLFEISSALDPTLVSPFFLERTGLSSFLTSGNTPESFAQLRVDSWRDSEYEKKIWTAFEPAFYPNLTRFGLIDIQTNDDSSVEYILSSITSDAQFGSRVRREIKTAIQNKKIWKKKDLEDLLGLWYPVLKSRVHREAPWNVNFLPELLLRSTMTHKVWSIPNGGGKAEALLSIRKNQAMDPQLLRSIGGWNDSDPIATLLGTISHGFLLILDYNGSFLYAVIYRVGSSADSSKEWMIREWGMKKPDPLGFPIDFAKEGLTND